MLVSLFRKIFATLQEARKVKPLRQISAATILSLMLAVSVLAGQVDTPGAPAPAPAPATSTTQTTSTTTAIVLTVLSLIYR
jgi:hypothetical protein